MIIHLIKNVERKMPSFEREASSRGKYIKVPRIFMPKASCKAA